MRSNISRAIQMVNGDTPIVYSYENATNYRLYGTPSLSSGWSMTFSGTPAESTEIDIFNEAVPTLNGYSVTIFGVVVPSGLEGIKSLIKMVYQNSAWTMIILPAFSESGFVLGRHILNGTITRAKLESDIIDGTKIEDDAIAPEHIADNAVTTAAIANDAVTVDKIADDAVTAAQIADDAVTENHLNASVAGNGLQGANGTALSVKPATNGGVLVAAGGVSVDVDSTTIELSGGKIAVKGTSITASQLASDAVTTVKVLDGAITNGKLAGSIGLDKLAALTASRALVSDGSGAISASAVTATTLSYLDATSSVQTQLNAKMSNALTDSYIFVGNGSNVATGRAVTGDISLSNTGVAAIAAGVIVNADINASAAIAFSKLASLSTGQILAGNGGTPTAVTVSGDATINASGVVTIANDAVTEVKILDGAVTNSKLAADAVDTTNILDDAVTTAKILDGAVTADKLSAGTITSAKLSTNYNKRTLMAFANFNASSSIGTYKAYVPFDGTLSYIYACAIQDIGATDKAYIQFQDNGGNNMSGTGLTTGKIEFNASDTVGTTVVATPTGNNTFTAGQIINLLPTKATPNGGMVLLTLVFDVTS